MTVRTTERSRMQGPRNVGMHYREAVQKNYRALREQGLNVDVIAMEHSLSDYKVLAAPMAYMFKDGYEEKASHLCGKRRNSGAFLLVGTG